MDKRACVSSFPSLCDLAVHKEGMVADVWDKSGRMLVPMRHKILQWLGDRGGGEVSYTI